MAIREYALVLQPTNNDGRCNPELSCESRHIRQLKVAESALEVLRNQDTSSKSISLLLNSEKERIHRCFFRSLGWLYKYIFLPMKKDVPRLVEERKPKDVLPFVPKAQLNKRLSGAEPPGRPVDPSSMEVFNNNYCNSSLGAGSNKRFVPLIWIEARESAGILKGVAESISVEWSTVDLPGLDLANAKPRS